MFWDQDRNKVTNQNRNRDIRNVYQLLEKVQAKIICRMYIMDLDYAQNLASQAYLSLGLLFTSKER